MIYNLEIGDLVTGHRGHEYFLARPAGTDYWTMCLPRCCIMTVIEQPARRNVNEPLHVTLLVEERLVEVLLADVERLESVTQ